MSKRLDSGCLTSVGSDDHDEGQIAVRFWLGRYDWVCARATKSETGDQAAFYTHPVYALEPIAQSEAMKIQWELLQSAE